jgi:hypothetical protein
MVDFWLKCPIRKLRQIFKSISMRAKPAHTVCFLGTLLIGPRCLADPTCQPHFFIGGKPLRTRPATAPVTAQTHSLPLLRHRRSSPAKFSSTGRPPVTTLSRRVSYGAPWCPVTAARLHLLLAALPVIEIPAMPRANVLHPSLCELPSHPFSCHLACEPLASRIAAEASRRPAAPEDRCQGRCAATMPALSTRRQGLAQCLCFLLLC